MRYGAMNFPIKPLLEEINALASMGFDYLELSMDAPQTHYLQVLSLQKEIQHLLEANNMGLVCHLPTFVCTADLTPGIRDAARREIDQSLKAAHALNAEKVVVHPSIITGLGPFVIDLSMQYAKESLRMIIARSSELELPLCLENMFPRYNSYFEADHFTNDLQAYPELQITLDIGHANIQSPGEKRFLDFIRQHGDRIGHVHISDNRGTRDDHLPIGDGNINWKKVVRALQSCGYNATMTLEVFSENRAELHRSLLRAKSLFKQ
jgi:sugar phosphate isomerase/epimerase